MGLEQIFFYPLLQVSFQDPSKLLAEFFNGEVIKLDEEYAYDA